MLLWKCINMKFWKPKYKMRFVDNYGTIDIHMWIFRKSSHNSAKFLPNLKRDHTCGTNLFRYIFFRNSYNVIEETGVHFRVGVKNN